MGVSTPRLHRHQVTLREKPRGKKTIWWSTSCSAAGLRNRVWRPSGFGHCAHNHQGGSNRFHHTCRVRAASQILLVTSLYKKWDFMAWDNMEWITLIWIQAQSLRPSYTMAFLDLSWRVKQPTRLVIFSGQSDGDFDHDGFPSTHDSTHKRKKGAWTRYNQIHMTFHLTYLENCCEEDSKSMALWICYDLLKGWALPPCWHHFGTVFFERPWPTSMWKATLKLNWSFSSLIHSCNVKRKPSWVISLKNHDGTLAGVNLPER